jgi:hypothetical protein
MLHETRQAIRLIGSAVDETKRLLELQLTKAGVTSLVMPPACFDFQFFAITWPWGFAQIGDSTNGFSAYCAMNAFTSHRLIYQQRHIDRLYSVADFASQARTN